MASAPDSLESLSVESSPPIPFGPGVTLRFFYTPSYPDNSPYKRYTETTYDPSLPGAKPMIVPSHWHANHDEFLSVIEGEIEAQLGIGPDAKRVTLKPGVPAVCAPRRTLHSLTGRQGVKTVLREGTSYGNVRAKEQFLRHVSSDISSTWNAIRASYDGDAYRPCTIMGYRSEALEMAIAAIIGSLATVLGMAAPPPKLPEEEAYMAKAK